MDHARQITQNRPSVAVVVPYGGGGSGAAEVIRRVGRLGLRFDDEVIIVDNGRAGQELDAQHLPCGVRVTPARALRSSYYARNVGVEQSSADWILFLDADCVPPHDLLDSYFLSSVEECCGAVAGAVAASSPGTRTVARFAATRRHLDQADSMSQSRPYGATANLLVRRVALDSVGGFCEGIRSGGDQDLCWRLHDAGWLLSYRPAAGVLHEHRESVGALIEQWARYGSGRAWLLRRHPGSLPPMTRARRSVRHLLFAAALALRGQREAAIFRLLDTVVLAAHAAGSLASNRSLGSRSGPVVQNCAMVAVAFPPDASPAKDSGASGPGRVEALRRPAFPQAVRARGHDVFYAEDDGVTARAIALLWLGARRPRVLYLLQKQARVNRRRKGEVPTWSVVFRRLARTQIRRVRIVGSDELPWPDVWNRAGLDHTWR